ncbi:type VI secretion system tube protein TssD [uncultured Aquimarina sp.]|uniref:type VI secretion system tube protein TssD n=1 Tax=uncultured Aquimarina sp. TaxID=575652 RepID=UPI002608CB86|nr:type VI secretion system tube protein TssD [uncultured Aquimarina sp.]
MAFQAKLFINDEERNVLNSAFLYQQLVDANGRPQTTIQNGKIHLLVESTKNDELFYDWMFSTHTMYNGYVRFYKRDGFSKLFDFEFGNCHCVQLDEKFNAEGNDPLKMELLLSPGIQRVRGQVFEKNWNPSNPFAEAAPITEREENKELVLESAYFEDDSGNKITELENGKAYLVIKTKDGQGKTVDIDLSSREHDFKYNGKILEDDVLTDVSIVGDITKVLLEIIDEQNV